MSSPQVPPTEGLPPAPGPWQSAPAATAPALPQDWGSPAGSVIAGLAGLAAGWLATLAMMLLALGGAVLAAHSWADGGSSDGGSSDVDTVSDVSVGPLLKAVTQAYSMAFGNPLGAHTLGVGGSGTFALLGITVAFCAATWYAARVSTRRWAVGSGPGNLALATVAGLVNGAVLSLLARLTAFRADEVSVHSAGFAGFLGCALLTAVAVAAGRAHGVGRQALPGNPLVREALRGIKAFGYHVLVLGGVLLALGWLYLAVRLVMEEHVGAAFGSLLALPLVGVNLLEMGFGLTTFGPLSIDAKGSLDLFGGLGLGSLGLDALDDLPRLSAGIFDAPQWWVPVVGLLVSAAALCLTALFWGARRLIAGAVTSWLVLPLTYLLGGTVLMLASRLALRTDGLGGARASLGLAGWWPIVLAMFGLAVELAARYLVPTLRAIVPVNAYWWRPEAEMATLPGWRTPAAPVVPAAPAIGSPTTSGLASAALLGATSATSVPQPHGGEQTRPTSGQTSARAPQVTTVAPQAQAPAPVTVTVQASSGSGTGDQGSEGADDRTWYRSSSGLYRSRQKICVQLEETWQAAVRAGKKSASIKAHDDAILAGCDPAVWTPNGVKHATVHESHYDGESCSSSEAGTVAIFDDTYAVCTQQVEDQWTWEVAER